jgi:hypothetical protein
MYRLPLFLVVGLLPTPCGFLTNELIENIYIIGSIDALHNWDANNAIILSAASYPIWSGQYHVSLPPLTDIHAFIANSDYQLASEHFYPV